MFPGGGGSNPRPVLTVDLYSRLGAWTQLNALAVTTGWTIGVVIALFLVVLLVGALGTTAGGAECSSVVLHLVMRSPPAPWCCH